MSQLFPKSRPALDNVLKELSEENIRLFFKERLKESRGPISHMEFGSVAAFSDFSEALKPEDAFEVIPTAVKIVKDWKGSVHIETAISFLGECAQATETTELPKELENNWKAIESMIQDQELESSVFWTSLKNWYRK